MMTASTGAGNSSASSAGHGSSGPAATRAAKEETASSATSPSQAASRPVHLATVGGVERAVGELRAVPGQGRGQRRRGRRTVPGSGRGGSGEQSAAQVGGGREVRLWSEGVGTPPRRTGRTSGAPSARPRRPRAIAAEPARPARGRTRWSAARPAGPSATRRAAYAHSSRKVVCCGIGVQPRASGDVAGGQPAGPQQPGGGSCPGSRPAAPGRRAGRRLRRRRPGRRGCGSGSDR